MRVNDVASHTCQALGDVRAITVREQAGVGSGRYCPPRHRPKSRTLIIFRDTWHPMTRRATSARPCAGASDARFTARSAVLVSQAVGPERN
jgi:hypothetical protein